LELPGQEAQRVPPGQKISHLFAEMGRAMLILGEPGSGKTITLLELARELIAQSEADETFSQPLPVVFNLSAWQTGQSLGDWLTTELSVKYQIPHRIGRPLAGQPQRDGAGTVGLAVRRFGGLAQL
jgi:predicted NACHT family NTPase